MSKKDKERDKILSEKFIKEYCKLKGWDINSLLPKQLLEIIEQRRVKKD